MELCSVVKFLEDRTILVTGATGFLAKIFVEKILRVQPNVKKLYLLVRATDAETASQRLHNEIISKDLFRVLKKKMGGEWTNFVSEKVTSVCGDITFENLGVKNSDLVDIWNEVEVVVHIAATTNFDERAIMDDFATWATYILDQLHILREIKGGEMYDVSLHLNTFGARNVLNFSKKCVNLKGVLHVSTAYVSGEREGLILEDQCLMGVTINRRYELDIELEKQLIEQRLNELRATRANEKETTKAMKDLGIERAKKHGWPNTYVFTKAMGEMLLGQLKGTIPLVIFRPTIITSTFREPFPGWVEGMRTVDSIVIGYGKGKLTCIPGDPDCVIDAIPADMVVNAMIVAMAALAKKPHRETIVYHVGSGLANPVTIAKIVDYAQNYFPQHPSIGKDGRPVIVGRFAILNSMETFRIYMALHYVLPLKESLVMGANIVQHQSQDPFKMKAFNKLKVSKSDLTSYWSFFFCSYDDTNTKKLLTEAREGGVEMNLFYFDPKIISWDDYFLNTHIPGTVKYLIK